MSGLWAIEELRPATNTESPANFKRGSALVWRRLLHRSCQTSTQQSTSYVADETYFEGGTGEARDISHV